MPASIADLGHRLIDGRHGILHRRERRTHGSHSGSARCAGRFCRRCTTVRWCHRYEPGASGSGLAPGAVRGARRRGARNRGCSHSSAYRVRQCRSRSCSQFRPMRNRPSISDGEEDAVAHARTPERRSTSGLRSATMKVDRSSRARAPHHRSASPHARSIETDIGGRSAMPVPRARKVVQRLVLNFRRRRAVHPSRTSPRRWCITSVVADVTANTPPPKPTRPRAEYSPNLSHNARSRSATRSRTVPIDVRRNRRRAGSSLKPSPCGRSADRSQLGCPRSASAPASFAVGAGARGRSRTTRRQSRSVRTGSYYVDERRRHQPAASDCWRSPRRSWAARRAALSTASLSLLKRR